MPTPKNILIVDNGTFAAKYALDLLKESSYKLLFASSCLEARQIIFETNLDAILLGSPAQDQCLPPLDHLSESISDPAVIALLDADETHCFLDCHKQGALDCLILPFDQDKLYKSIERCLAIKALEREKRDFISMLSHDLKNPITAAIGSIDLVREKRLGPINQEQATYLMSAIESCGEVVNMIDNLLDVHKYEAGKLSFKQSSCSIAAILVTVLDRFKGSINQSELKLQVQIEEGLPTLLLDKNRMIRVFGNLMTNAIKFTPHGGNLNIECRSGVSEKSKLAIIIHVSDNGTGIPPSEVPTIFDRFVQGHPHSRRTSGGCGLGLAFCKMAVEGQGGSIHATSTLGVGTTFTIVMPVND